MIESDVNHSASDHLEFNPITDERLKHMQGLLGMSRIKILCNRVNINW